MTPEKERIAKGYDDIADIVGLDMSFYDRCIALHRGYNGRVLDVGCGRGFLLKKVHAVAPEAELYGIDISKKLCELSKENNPSAEIRQGDAEALPYADNSFDFVFMTEALEHMLDYDKALSEVRRVLKHKGIFIVTVPNRDWAAFDFYEKNRNKEMQPVDDHYFRVEEIKSYLQKNSFNVIKYRGADNLYYYAPYHKYEQFLAFFFPFLHLKMKRLLFKCVNEKP
jgi:ubiquinone/menaquinone biosynthesis C-methylase UbiE